MGHHKALLEWSGEPIVAAHCRAMMKAGGKVIVVLGAERSRIRPILPEGVTVRVNENWATTQMADSIRFALEHLTGGALVTPVDVPPAPEAVLRRLIQSAYPSVPCHQGEDGHPVWIDAVRTHSALRTDTLAAVLSDAQRLEVDWSGCTRSWNTPTEWAAQSGACR